LPLAWVPSPVTRLCSAISLFLPSSSGWRTGGSSPVSGARHSPARCSRSVRRTACSWTSPTSRAPWPKEQVSHSHTPASASLLIM
jgi:hypothetical protein